MNNDRLEADWEYRNLLFIWSGLLVAEPLLLLCLYLIDPEVIFVDFSKPFIGEHYILVPAAVLLAILDLSLAYYRHKSYLRQAIVDRNTELVQTALIMACANTVSVSMYGFLLWWFFAYPYFVIWMLVGFVATIFFYPRRSYLQAVRGMASFNS